MTGLAETDDSRPAICASGHRCWVMPSGRTWMGGAFAAVTRKNEADGNKCPRCGTPVTVVDENER